VLLSNIPVFDTQMSKSVSSRAPPRAREPKRIIVFRCNDRMMMSMIREVRCPSNILLSMIDEENNQLLASGLCQKELSCMPEESRSGLLSSYAHPHLGSLILNRPVYSRELGELSCNRILVAYGIYTPASPGIPRRQIFSGTSPMSWSDTGVTLPYQVDT